jgi:hypothetical protein
MLLLGDEKYYLDIRLAALRWFRDVAGDRLRIFKFPALDK